MKIEVEKRDEILVLLRYRQGVVAGHTDMFIGIKDHRLAKLWLTDKADVDVSDEVLGAYANAHLRGI